MVSQTSGSRWRVVIVAAARLATVYALGTALLLLPLYFAEDGFSRGLQDLREFATPVALAFALAFILLAVARRAGLVALWIVLGILWGVILRDSAVGHTDFVAMFIAWSALAIPLALLGGVGVPATLRMRLGRWTPAALTIAVVLWAALLIPSLAAFVIFNFWIRPWQELGFYGTADEFGQLAFTFGAPLIVALSIAHAWVGTAPVKIESPAA